MSSNVVKDAESTSALWLRQAVTAVLSVLYQFRQSRRGFNRMLQEHIEEGLRRPIEFLPLPVDNRYRPDKCGSIQRNRNDTPLFHIARNRGLGQNTHSMPGADRLF